MTRVWVPPGAHVVPGAAEEAADGVVPDAHEEVQQQLEAWPDGPLRRIAWAIMVEDRTDYDTIARENGHKGYRSAGFRDAVREIMRRLDLDEE